MKASSYESTGLAAGIGCLTIGIAASLVVVREELGTANAALILMLVVIGGAAIGGRLAGAIAAVTAALSFNFLYTKPYLTLRIHSGRDVLTTALLLAAGLAVGELAASKSRQTIQRRSHLQSMRSLESVGALVNAGATADEVWAASHEALLATLGVKEATFESGDQPVDLPVIQRDGHLGMKVYRFTGEGFALPSDGAALAVEAEGIRLGHITLVPDPSVGVTREQRRSAAAIADQFAIAYQREIHHA